MGDEQGPMILGELPPNAPRERWTRSTFAQRIERAQDLAAKYPFASEVLHFYVCLAGKQEDIYDSLRKPSSEKSSLKPSGGQSSQDTVGQDWPLNLDLVLPAFSGFARVVAEWAPKGLRKRADYYASADVIEQTQLLSAFWNGGMYADPADHFLALYYLQPYAEWLAESGRSAPHHGRPASCPVCGSEAVVAALREQDLGARRSLVCSLCSHEWDFLRVICPACGEDRFEALAVYAASEMPYLHVDACDTCKHYIKTVDLTKHGHAIPIVDELVAIPLDLWAREHGYKKITPNIVGV